MLRSLPSFGITFPSACSKLEEMSFRMARGAISRGQASPTADIVVSALMEIVKVPKFELWKLYGSLFDAAKGDDEQRFHLLSCLCTIITRWIAQLTSSAGAAASETPELLKVVRGGGVVSPCCASSHSVPCRLLACFPVPAGSGQCEVHAGGLQPCPARPQQYLCVDPAYWGQHGLRCHCCCVHVSRCAVPAAHDLQDKFKRCEAEIMKFLGAYPSQSLRFATTPVVPRTGLGASRFGGFPATPLGSGMMMSPFQTAGNISAIGGGPSGRRGIPSTPMTPK